MSVIRRLGGLVHRQIVRLTEGHLTPGTGIPFEWFLRAQATAMASDTLRRQIFGEELALLDRFLAARGIHDPAAIETAHRQRALASMIRRVRRYYDTLPPARLRRWLPIAPGVEDVVRGRGVFLVGAHFGGGLLTLPALSQLGVPMFAIVRTIPGATFKPPGVDVCDLRTEAAGRAVSRAWITLRQGGVVFLAGDGRSGHADRDIEVPLLGRPRQISQGFAQIAVAAGVTPQLIFSRVEADGTILTEVGAVLADGGGTTAERIQHLATTYAGQLTEMYQRFPGNVSPGAMRFALGERKPL